MISGKKERIQWAEESSFGVMSTNAYEVLPNAVVINDFKQNWEEVNNTGDLTYNYERGYVDVKYTLSFVVRTWRFFVMAFGDSTDVNNTTYFSHTLSEYAPLHSFTLQRIQYDSAIGSSSRILTYVGSKVDSITIDWNSEGGGINGSFVTITAKCTAKRVYEETTTGTVYSFTGDIFQARMTEVKINGVTYNANLSGSITITNNLNSGFYADSSSSYYRSENLPQHRRMFGEININYSNSTPFDLWATGSAVSGDTYVKFSRGEHDWFKIDMTGKMFLNSVPDNTNLDGLNILKFDFRVGGEPTITAEDAYEW